jgi:excisionase family DNA binding protein
MSTLLTEHQAALKLAVSTRKLQVMVRAGQIPFVRLPDGSVRFEEQQLAEWIESRRIGNSEMMLRGIPDAASIITS